ncbi:MAG: 4-hydroxythreonine-4-phosphate dehydrogenase PdxA [bacterium]
MSETRPGRRPAPLGVTLGDPAGVGPEVTLKALARLRVRRAVLVGPRAVIAGAARRLRLALPAGFAVDDTGNPGRFTPGRVQANCGAAALAALERGAELLGRGEVSALVTAPVSKAALRRAGFRWPGQTEFLAERLGAARTAMLAWTPRYKAVFVTIHLPLADVPGAITAGAVFEKAVLLEEFLRRELRRRPRIGVLALNPHGAEFGRGEERRIAAGVARARRAGVDAAGPVCADAVGPWLGRVDGWVAMYHDQAMIPAKLLGPGVNVTLGLGAVRTSPLHGTAFDIAGRGIADPGSMVAAIRLARRLARTA